MFPVSEATHAIPRAMGIARSFWLMGFSQRFGSEQLSVSFLGRIREGVLMPRTAEGVVGWRRWSGIRGPREWIRSGGVSMMG